MKRVGNIYGKICDYYNIVEAHGHARKDKHYYKEVKMIDENPRPYLESIRKSLIDKTYVTSPYETFEKFDTGKIRVISKLPYFPDRIIHWALLLQTSDVFERVFIPQTHAAIPGRGVHSAMLEVKRYIERDPIGTQFCLKFDVRKYFPSISHDILKEMLRKVFKDPDVLWLWDTIIDSVDGDYGIPIGNYTSQYLANFYLAYFDHWVKENLKIKYHTRYMDDNTQLNGCKDTLHQWLGEESDYLWDELELKVKDNYAIFPISSRSIDFAGYKNWGVTDDMPDSCKITLRKSTWKNARRTMLDIRKMYERTGVITEHQFCQFNSYEGWVKWCINGKMKRDYFDPLRPAMDEYRKSISGKQND